MKKIFLLIILFIYSCDNTKNINKEENINGIIVNIKYPNGSYTKFITFEYDGHKYMSDICFNFIYHLESCQCKINK